MDQIEKITLSFTERCDDIQRKMKSLYCAAKCSEAHSISTFLQEKHFILCFKLHAIMGTIW